MKTFIVWERYTCSYGHYVNAETPEQAVKIFRAEGIEYADEIEESDFEIVSVEEKTD